MKINQSNLSSAVAAIAIMLAGTGVHAAGFQQGLAADQSGKPIVIGIWYPRQVSRVIDHMLSTWEGRAAIDPRRVGMFGFSAGGFTTLAIIGGVPDFTTIGPMCRQYPGDFVCQLVTRSESPVVAPATIAVADARIKAAVVAAPALGFTFSPDGLKNVKVRARHRVDRHPHDARAGRAGAPRCPRQAHAPRALVHLQPGLSRLG